MLVNRTGSSLNFGPKSPSLHADRAGRSLIVTGSLLLLATGSAWASELPTAADAHVSSAHATTNYGTLSNISVGNGNTGLLRFDLSSLPTNTTASQVQKATLRLYVNRVFTPGTVNLLQLNAAWNESSVTYANQPASTGTESGIPVATAGQFVTIDVTSIVQQWVTSPTTNFGLGLSSTDGVVLFDSKENDSTSHNPQIDVVLAAAGTAGPTGPTGPTGSTGPIGPAGPAGPQGTAGSQGTAGAPGASGSQGPTGPQGPQGPQGQQGLTGAQGPVGPAGTAGPQGQQGLTGPQGPVGPAGTAGPQGPVGPQGTAGTQGASGAQGPAGVQGPQGPAGAIAFAANLALSSAGGSAGDYYGLPVGQPGISMYADASRVLLVPSTCLAASWKVVATGLYSGEGGSGAATVTLQYGTTATDLSSFGITLADTTLSCSLTYTGNGVTSCNSGTATFPLNQNQFITIHVNAPQGLPSESVSVLTSFVCH